MFDYNGKSIKKIGFLGLGKSNIGICQYLLNKLKNPQITLRCHTANDVSGITANRIFTGKNMLCDIDEDILFISPSARRDVRELIDAKRRGVILSSDAEFFFSLSHSDIYTITGSDGKSTTTYLTSCLLSEAYRDAVPCGNFGEALTPHLDDDPNTAYVAELSSFQLMYMNPKSERSLITNISKNHLNWHSSFEEYINAKRNIFDNSGQRIINYDCEITRSVARDYGIFAVFSRKESESALRRKINADIYVTEEDGKILVSGEKVLDIGDILVGKNHNVLNFMSAIAMSFGKCKNESIVTLAKGFGGLPNRCEFVAKIRGVSYFNSSIDSSPKRCVATLNMFSERVILIIGGRSKGLDFAELIPILKEKTKSIIITGECGREIECLLKSDKDFTESKIPFLRIDSFIDAVKYSAHTAKPGDTVLLSPAATSFDCFKNFEERGEFFKKTVKGLEIERK
jgi:UDP-N-acetylmuramoylalanine--D-glutamate ligase